MPLKALARGFARMVTGNGLGQERAKASKRLLAACMAEPFYVAGTGRACTRLMGEAPGRIFVKTGAEGVFCAAVPEFGLGIALKCEDGTTRASEVAITAVLATLFKRDDDLREARRHGTAPFAELERHRGRQPQACRTPGVKSRRFCVLFRWSAAEFGAVASSLHHPMVD